MNFKVTFVLLLLVCLVSQVYSSIACYSCSHLDPGKNDTNCMLKPEQLQYIKYCSISSLSDVYKDMLKSELNRAGNDITFKCATLEAKSSDQLVFRRYCIPSFVTCDIIEKDAVLNEFDGKINRCEICDTDICNSSNKFGIAIFTLIPCLIAYYIFK